MSDFGKSNILLTRDSKGKIRQINISCNKSGSVYEISRKSGIVGGKFVDHPKIIIDKGKVKRTLEQQAELEYNSNIKSYLDKGYKLFNTIPDNIELEINGGNDLDLIVDSLENNLILDNIHRLKIRINEDSNIKVETITDHDGVLQGNVKWNTTEISNGDSTRYSGELVYGDGNNIINILNCYEILVDGI